MEKGSKVLGWPSHISFETLMGKPKLEKQIISVAGMSDHLLNLPAYEADDLPLLPEDFKYNQIFKDFCEIER